MLKTLLFVFLYLSVLTEAFCQIDKAYLKKHARPKHLPVPPNGVWLYDNVFIDETEIANIHWLEYLHYLTEKDSIQNRSFSEILPISRLEGLIL